MGLSNGASHLLLLIIHLSLPKSCYDGVGALAPCSRLACTRGDRNYGMRSTSITHEVSNVGLGRGPMELCRVAFSGLPEACKSIVFVLFTKLSNQ